MGLRKPALCVSKSRIVMASIGAKLIVHLSQFGHIADGAVIQRELAPVAQLQNGDCGHRLGDRGPVVRCSSVDGLLGIFAWLAEEQLRCRFVHVDDGDPTAHHPVLRQNCIEALRKSSSLCARGGGGDQRARESPPASSAAQAVGKGFDMRVMIIRLPDRDCASACRCSPGDTEIGESTGT